MKKGIALFLCFAFLFAFPSAAFADDAVDMRFCWWGGESRHAPTLAACDLYHEVNPNVTVTGEYGEWSGYVDKLLTQLASGTAPDIIQVDSKLYFELGNFVVDLNEMGDTVDLSVYDQDFLKNYCSYDGKLVGVPTGMNAISLLFSKQFFDKFNIPYDTVWTWDNLLEIGERVHKEDPNAYLFVADPLNLQIMMRAYVKQLIGTQLVNDDYTLNITEEVMTSMLAYVKEMIDRGVLQPFSQAVLYTDVQETNPDWIAGNLGMTVKHCSLITRFTESGFDIGTAVIPQMENAKDTGVLLSVANLLSINNSSQYIKEAGDFINWFMTDEQAILTLGECRSTHSTEKGREILEKAELSNAIVKNAIDEAVAHASSFPENAISQNQELESILDDGIEKVGFGQMTPEEGAKYIIDSFESVLYSLQ